MEIDITSFFNAAAPMDYSASVAEIGRDAGPATWQAACDDSPDNMLLDTAEKRAAFRAFVRESGGWTDEEIAQWDAVHLNALFLQWVAGDMREPVGFELGPGCDWAEYERQCNAGHCHGNIYPGDDGRVYFYAGI